MIMNNEGLTTEFKLAYTEDIKKTVIAFANTAGGEILIGVADDGTVVGVDDADAAMLQQVARIRRRAMSLQIFGARTYPSLIWRQRPRDPRRVPDRAHMDDRIGIAAAQQATVEVMDAQPAVIGWRRQMDADPCQLCKWWYMGVN